MSQGGLQNIELAADSQRVSERLYNLLAVGEGGMSEVRPISSVSRCP